MPDDAEALSLARELYALPPSQFTAARNAMAKDLQAEKRTSLSKSVREFPRPSASAWAVNRIASADEALKADFETLGKKLRAAQARADSGVLAALLPERKALLANALRASRELAKTESVALSASAAEEISQTLQAALADADGFAAAVSGRLVRPIRSDGLEPVDLDGALAGPPLVRSVQPSTPDQGSRAKTRGATSASRAKADLRQAAIRKADDALRDADAKLEELAAEQDQLSEDVAALQAQFDELQARQEALDTRSAKVNRERSKALAASRHAHGASER